MEFQDVVSKRRMIRSYSNEPVAREQIDRMLDNAVRAPSAGFSQGWSFLVLDTRADIDRYWDIFVGDDEWEADNWLKGMRTAPVLIFPCVSKAAYLSRYAEPDKGWTDQDESRWPMPFWYMDTAMATLLILQTAVDEGLGACFFGIPPRHDGEFRRAFGIPDDVEPIGVVSVGHPAEGGARGSGARRARRPTEEIVHTGRW